MKGPQVAVGLVMLLLLLGALHYSPLWFFVLLVPPWPWWVFVDQERRARAATIERMREIVSSTVDEQEG